MTVEVQLDFYYFFTRFSRYRRVLPSAPVFSGATSAWGLNCPLDSLCSPSPSEFRAPLDRQRKKQHADTKQCFSLYTLGSVTFTKSH